MHPDFRKVALAAALLGFIVSIAVAACGGDNSESEPATTAVETRTAPPATTATTATTAPTATTTTAATTATAAGRTIAIVVKGAQPVGGIQRPSVKKGDNVTLVVTSDVADEIHLHGYDLAADAAPGKPARITFLATIPGRFEVELENRSVQIADLEVTP